MKFVLRCFDKVYPDAFYGPFDSADEAAKYGAAIWGVAWAIVPVAPPPMASSEAQK